MLTPIEYSRLLGLVAVVTLTGCIRSRITGFDPTTSYDRRTPADQIRMYASQRPSCAYKEVGLVTAKGGMFASWGNVVRKARELAHEMGGDAIVGVNEQTRISHTAEPDGGLSTSESTSITGVVIRFTNPTCRE
jgi:hypothetical protein